MTTSTFRRADFLMTLAYATDLATGQSRDFALRSCVLAMRLAKVAGLDDELRRQVYHQALLRYIGCNADTHLLSAAFGDEIALRQDLARIDMGSHSDIVETFVRAFTRLFAEAPPAALADAVQKGLAEAMQVSVPILAGHCEVAQRIAQRIGLSEDIRAPSPRSPKRRAAASGFRHRTFAPSAGRPACMISANCRCRFRHGCGPARSPRARQTPCGCTPTTASARWRRWARTASRWRRWCCAIMSGSTAAAIIVTPGRRTSRPPRGCLPPPKRSRPPGKGGRIVRLRAPPPLRRNCAARSGTESSVPRPSRRCSPAPARPARRDTVERLAGLTAREIEVLRLIAAGHTAKEAARELEIAPKTADNHIQSLYSKIGVSTRAGAALYALERGLVQQGLFAA